MNLAQTQTEPNIIGEGAHGKFLVFKLGQDAYAISALHILEILHNAHATPVPRMPSYIKGVMNLRGRIMPLIDLRERFEIAHATEEEQLSAIVVQVELSQQRLVQVGLIVDCVESVINLDQLSIEPTPDAGSAVDTRFILGIAHNQETLIRLLDVTLLIECQTLGQNV